MRSLTYKLSLALIFVMPWEGIIQFPGLGTGAKLLGFIVAAFWLVTVLIRGQFRNPGLFHIMFCVFVLWNAISTFWSALPTRTLAHLATWIQLLALVFILWDLYTTEKSLVAGMQAYILGAYVAVGSAILNFSRGNAFYTHYQRFSAGNTNPDGFGFILVLGLPLAWYLAASNTISKKSRFWMFVNYAYIPLAFWGIALSGTRTALIASVIATFYGITVVVSRVRPWRQALMILVLILAANYALPTLENLKSFQRLGTTEAELTQGSLNERTDIWREGIASFVVHPWLGVGGNMFRSVNTFAKDASGKVGHNTYLSVLVELGLIGFLIFASMLLIAFVQALRLPKWEAWLWLNVFAVWSIGAFALTWEPRKTTWLFLSFIVLRAALKSQPEESETLIQSAENTLPGLSEAPLRRGAAKGGASLVNLTDS